MDPRHKNIRLPHDNYVGQQWFFVTICCEDRRNIFITPEICGYFLEILYQDAAIHSFAVHAYCLMPDHIHLLLEGRQLSSDLPRFIKALKTKTTLWFKRKTAQPLWQKKFYDHILRRNDSPDAVAWYIWTNPVRAGLCHTPDDYPFLGSLTGRAPKTVKPITTWHPPWRPPCSGRRPWRAPLT